MPPDIMGSGGYVEMPHELAEISKGRLNKEMKMIIHEYIAVKGS